MKNKILKIIPFLIVAIFVGVTTTYATSKLTPPETVTNTMYSLEDIYNLASGTTIEEGTGEFVAGTLPVSETGKTLTEVYEAVATALESLPPTLTWQTDPSLNLCWSHGQYEIDNGCVVGNGFIQTPDENTDLGAVEYCQYLNEDGTTLANTSQNIWHLPTIEEYQSITDFTLYNNATEVTGFVEGTIYWSSTSYAEDSRDAWLWFSWSGYTNSYPKDNQRAVRCAR